MLPDQLISDEEHAEAMPSPGWVDSPDFEAVFPTGIPVAPDTTLDFGDTTFEVLHGDDVPEWLAKPVLGAELGDQLPPIDPNSADTQLLGLVDESAVAA